MNRGLKWRINIRRCSFQTNVGFTIIVRLCLFWVKITFGNAFSEMRLFGWSGKFYFPEIEIRWPKKDAFDHRNQFTLLFSLQSISGKWERERENARARERRSVGRRDCAVDRDLAVAIDGERGRSKIAIDALRDRAVDLDLAKKARLRSRRRSRSPVVVDDFFLGCGLCFSGFVFSFFFSKHQKIFFGN